MLESSNLSSIRASTYLSTRYTPQSIENDGFDSYKQRRPGTNLDKRPIKNDEHD